MRLPVSTIHSKLVKNTSAFHLSRSALGLMAALNAGAPVPDRWKAQLFKPNWVVRKHPDSCYYWVVDATPNRLLVWPMSARRGQQKKFLECGVVYRLTQLVIQSLDDVTVHEFKVELTAETEAAQRQAETPELPPVCLSMSDEQAAGKKLINYLADKEHLWDLSSAVMTLLLKEFNIPVNGKQTLRVMMAQLLLHLGYSMDAIGQMLPPEGAARAQNNGNLDADVAEVADHGPGHDLLDLFDQVGL